MKWTCDQGEEAHASILDSLGESQLAELDAGPNCHQTVTFAGEKIVGPKPRQLSLNYPSWRSCPLIY